MSSGFMCARLSDRKNSLTEYKLLLKNKTSLACANGKQKEHDEAQFSRCTFYVCWKKEAVKEHDKEFEVSSFKFLRRVALINTPFHVAFLLAGQ